MTGSQQFLRTLRTAGFVFVGMLVLGLTTQQAEAQTFGRSSQQSASRYGKILGNRYDASKRAPSVSPYLNLLQPQGFVLPNYYTFVRPEIQRQQEQFEQRLAIGRLEVEVEEQQRQDRISGASRTIRGTGHHTQFNNYSHYYPLFNTQRELPQRGP